MIFDNRENYIMTPVERFQMLYQEMHNLCQEEGWGDPFSYARSREIYMAGLFNHNVATTYSGADAYDGEIPVEYKSTIGKTINATYNGISVQETPEEQKRYIVEDKIGKYPFHFTARFDGGKVVEAYKLSSDSVLSITLPKIMKQYDKKKNGNAKDPRIGVTLSQKEIKQNGEQII